MSRVVFLALLTFLTACPKSSGPAGKPTLPDETPDKTPDPETLWKVVEETNFVTGGQRERVVVSQQGGRDRWRIESSIEVAGPPFDLQQTLRIETEADGAFASGQFQQTVSANGQSQTSKVSMIREGNEIVATQDGQSTRAPAGDLFLTGEVVGQMVRICAAGAPRRMSAIGGQAIALGAPEPAAIEGYTRFVIDFGPGGGRADVYCRGEELIAIDGPGRALRVREEAEDAFDRIRRPLPVKPAPPEEVVETEQTIAVKATKGATATTLSCSLVTPKGTRSRGPAVVLLTGDGFHDRDNDPIFDTGKRALFRHIAYRLGPLGITTLRCDDRGIGGSAGDQNHTVETMTADATAMIAALRAHKLVDKKRIGLIAIGENALVAPKVWKATGVGALVLIEPRVTPIDEVMLQAIEAQLRAEGMDAQIEPTREAFTKAIAEVKAGRPLPDDAPPILHGAFSGPAGEYVRSFLAYDAAKAAAAIQKTDVLLIDATYDDGEPIQYEGDAEALAAILKKPKGKKKNTVAVLPLADVDSTLAPREPGEEGLAAPAWAPHAGNVVNHVVEYLSQNL